MNIKNSDGDHWECGRCGKTYRYEDNFHEDENSTEYWCDACEAARQAGKALGSIRTAKKAAASRKNGKKGGRPRMDRAEMSAMSKAIRVARDNTAMSWRGDRSHNHYAVVRMRNGNTRIYRNGKYLKTVAGWIKDHPADFAEASY